MKFQSNNILVLTILLLSVIFVGCAQQTSPLQNQYGPRAAATQTQTGVFDNLWLSGRLVHPSFAIATNNNLGLQIVRQDEIIKPRPLGAPNPMAAVGAVDRYQKGQVRALADIDTTVGGSSGSSR
jgi:hypothetical protein